MAERHDDSDEETYVTLGSAFKLLETPEDIQRAKERKEKEQYVTDSRGRRRFHGAFTGGFSAGYFNTVGSEEGWAPSSFISSRGKKADFATQKPEDYMDEEDLNVHGIAPREVATREEFFQERKRSHPTTTTPSVIPGAPPLQNLIVPTRSTIGAQLLRAMGWKEGEGVGPKVMKYPPKQQEDPKVYGCAHPRTTPEEDPHSKAGQGFMFAPRDVTPRQIEGKDDMHGIGYSGMEKQTVLKQWKATKALYGMSGEAFGIGALEDEDDEDVYGTESMTSYDVTLAAEGDIAMERKFGWTGGPESDSWSLKTSFVKASRPLPRTKIYPAPSVPRDFVPVHKFTATITKKPDTETAAHQKPLTSNDRSQLVSDKLVSVFSLLGTEERQRLQRATEMAHQTILGPQQTTKTPVASTSPVASTPPVATSHTPPVASTSHTPLVVSTSHTPPTSHREPHSVCGGSHSSAMLTSSKDQPEASKFSLENLKPFASDLAKQARYEAYLAGRQSFSGREYSMMTEWERQREREEFTRTAKVFRPFSASLDSRFTREGGGEETEQRPESDAVQAAQANMFGVLTRETLEWHPHRVLCKRFNVPEPYPRSGLVGVATGDEHQRTSDSRTLQFMQTEITTSGIHGKEQSQTVSTQVRESTGLVLEQASSSRAQTIAEVVDTSAEVVDTSTGDNAEEKNIEEEIHEETRPPMDLFKAIFAESSSESEMSDMESEQQKVTSRDHMKEKTAAEPELHTKDPARDSHVTFKSSTVQPRQWQDLSLVATTRTPVNTTSEMRKPLLSTPEPRQPALPQQLAHSSLPNHTNEVKASLRTSGSNDVPREVPNLASSKVDAQIFGPALPPEGSDRGYSPSDTSDTDRNTLTRHSSKHKHQHHKKSHRKDEKKSHVRDSREHKKSKHKHSRH